MPTYVVLCEGRRGGTLPHMLQKSVTHIINRAGSNHCGQSTKAVSGTEQSAADICDSSPEPEMLRERDGRVSSGIQKRTVPIHPSFKQTVKSISALQFEKRMGGFDL